LSKTDHSIKIKSTTLANFKRHKKIINQNSIFYYKTQTNKTPRLGISISKKAIKLAVIRNLIKRRILEDFKIKSKNLNNIQILIVISNKIYSEKNEISDILMQEWTQSIKSLLKPHQQ
jgi:ribonuclease P protein component